MKIIICIFLFLFPILSLPAQTINQVMLAKYSQRSEQEKLIDRQVLLLKLSQQQTVQFKQWSFYYADKALAIVKANTGSSYNLYKKVKPLKTEFESVMKKILTPAQVSLWNEDRKKNGIVAKVLK